MIKGVYNNSAFKDRRRKLRAKQTPAEKILWQHLRNRQLEKCKFWRQYSVGPYILDFYCPQIRLAIEVDGGQHQDAIEYDQERENYLAGLDIKTIRYTNNEVMKNPENILENIRTNINKIFPISRLPLSGKREEGREIVNL